VIIAAPLVPQPKAIYDEGVAVVCVRAPRPTDHGRAAGAKASNYLANLLAVHDARQRGGYEAILLGPGGEVLEGASSNVFVVANGQLRTPRLESAILAGITREGVLSAARAEGIPVEETALFPRDLYGADEVFITSTLREVVPVVRVDDHPIGSGGPGPVTKRLWAAFRRSIDEARPGR
jgi:branched-chain amino acid aminotransferase